MKKQTEVLVDVLINRGNNGQIGITQLEALQVYGIGRLASRIWDLKQEGYIIDRKMLPVLKADGTKTEVAAYKIDPANACYKKYAYATTKVRAIQFPDLSVGVEESRDCSWYEYGFPGYTRTKHRRILSERALKEIAEKYIIEKEARSNGRID